MKALDSVELLWKLTTIGVTGDAWLWVKWYLSNRYQCVGLGDSKSDLLPVVSGVPQGSLLGPLLFLVFINDLPERVQNSLLLLFADDPKCAKPVSDSLDQLELQKDLDSMCGWSDQWKLFFKEEKCVVLCYNKMKSYTDRSHLIYNNLGSNRESHKDLGLMVTTDLSFSTSL